MKKGKKYLIGNWKMNPLTLDEAGVIFNGIKKAATKTNNLQVVVCPPSLYTSHFAKKTSDKLALGVQNFFYEEKGSFTGEISAPMAEQFGVRYAILGHSERRVRGETSEDVAKKAAAALKEGITPIVCIGERERDTEGAYLEYIAEQLLTSIGPVKKTELAKILIAYEPVWAIGAATAMSAYDLHQMVIFIRKTLIAAFGKEVAEKPVIIYGGAVTADNAKDIIENGEVQGLLVGRESLKPESFAGIMKVLSK